MQNNLMEYFTMIDFVRPSLLGNQKEFANLYAPLCFEMLDQTPECACI